MSRLGEISSVARKTIKYGSIGLVSLMIGRVMFNAGRTWWKARNPDPPPPPDVKFGKLPPLHFPVTDQPLLQYILETRTGGLPSLEPQFTVYFMPIKKASLLAYDQAVKLANKLGFIQEPQQLSDTEYRWNGSSPVSSSFTMDVITGEFVLDLKWQEDESYLSPTFFISEERSAKLSENYLSRIGLLPEDIGSETSTVQFLKAQDGQLVSAVSLSKSQFLRVNLFRAPVENILVVNPLVDKGLISMIIALQREDAKQFVNVNYSYFPVELDQNATYPLIGIQPAWQRLQEGKSFIASVDGGVDNVVVRDIYLAYYDADTPQQFLQPVYVFEGDNDFTAYVPALSDEWVQ